MGYTRKTRGYSRYYLLFFGCLILFVAFLWASSVMVRKMEFFNFEKITVHGNKNLNDDYLKELCSDFLGKNLYAFSIQDIEARYSNITRIKQVKAHRIIPNQIRLKFIEREAFALVKTKNGTLYPIDKQRVVLDDQLQFIVEDVPIISSYIPQKKCVIGATIEHETTRKIFDYYNVLYNEDSHFAKTISELYIKDDDVYFSDLETGCQIFLGNKDFKKSVSRFKFAKNQGALETGYILNFDFKNQIVAQQVE